MNKLVVLDVLHYPDGRLEARAYDFDDANKEQAMAFCRMRESIRQMHDNRHMLSLTHQSNEVMVDDEVENELIASFNNEIIRQFGKAFIPKDVRFEINEHRVFFLEEDPIDFGVLGGIEVSMNDINHFVSHFQIHTEVGKISDELFGI